MIKGNKDGISFQITPIREIFDGIQYRVSIQVPFWVGWIERMKFLVSKGGERMAFQLDHIRNENEMVYFETKVNLSTYAVYHFCFSFEANRIFRYFKKKDITEQNCITMEETWKMSVNFRVPDWAKGGNMYHIFVDRYRRGGNDPLLPMPNRTIHKEWDEYPVLGPNEDGQWNIDFYGGNLKGIEETLSYLKRMGITIIYLSPLMRSQSNHRYDTADYREVDPYAGTNEHLKELCTAAHKRGMWVILDIILNHTGDDSIYFNRYGTFDSIGAFQSENSPYFNFYKHFWDGSKNVFGYWQGNQNMPVCNGSSPDWISYSVGEGGTIDHYNALGIDGYREDVIDELIDPYIRMMRVAIKRGNPNRFFIGEVWYNAMRTGRDYLSSGKGMDSTMNYFLIDALIRYFKYGEHEFLRNTINEIITEYPDDSIFSAMNSTSTHDISRIIEIFGCDEFQRYGDRSWKLKNESLDWIRNHKLTSEQYKRGKEIFKVYFFALAYMPGIVSIFYGDEVGMQGIGNLANRGSYPWGRRDKDLFRFVKCRLRNRNRYEFLKTADWNVLMLDSEKFMYERRLGERKLLVVVNASNETLGYLRPEEYEHAIVLDSIKSNGYYLKPHDAVALLV